MTVPDYIEENLGEQIVKIVISKPRVKTQQYRKILIEKKKNNYLVSNYTQTQAFHQNISLPEVISLCCELMDASYLQLNAWSAENEYSILISKKGKASFLCRRNDTFICSNTSVSHNRVKKYLLPAGQQIGPLIDMGVFTQDGKIVTAMYHKYRQINRFLEIVDDAVRSAGYTKLNIIDFGCGKSYLTFVLYYYLTEVLSIDTTIVGLDLKKDVIKKCNDAAKKYGYTKLTFELGDINGFKAPFDVDMVITLHACDTATDYAIFNAIQWKAKMIFSVPCCQHELNQQAAPEHFKLLTRYGIIKERTFALLTDAMRANLLECAGYRTQILEFIDFEHTPKNILIRAIRRKQETGVEHDRALAEVEEFIEVFHVNPTLYRLMMNSNLL